MFHVFATNSTHRFNDPFPFSEKFDSCENWFWPSNSRSTLSMDEKTGDDWDWEDRISRGFKDMVQIQDQETGECWTVAKESDCMSACGESKAACNRIKQTVSGWKIPKEYSLLGCSSSFKAECTQPVFATVRQTTWLQYGLLTCDTNCFSQTG
jgi:hypothetical protein